MSGCPTAFCRGWRRKLHAALLAKFNQHYEPLMAARKRALFSGLHGRVLEIGAGNGVNLPFFPKTVQWLGVDPNPCMAAYIAEAARRCGRRADFRVGVAEELPAEDASVDAVVSTLVLCCVKDPTIVLAEICRVLKPGGRFVFIEHVAAPPGSATRRRQKLICPIWSRLADGCHPNRETWRWISSAGFERMEIEYFRLPLPIAGPHIAGLAWKPASRLD